jgi:hypothetical protein
VTTIDITEKNRQLRGSLDRRRRLDLAQRRGSRAPAQGGLGGQRLVCLGIVEIVLRELEALSRRPIFPFSCAAMALGE